MTSLWEEQPIQIESNCKTLWSLPEKATLELEWDTHYNCKYSENHEQPKRAAVLHQNCKAKSGEENNPLVTEAAVSQSY